MLKKIFIPALTAVSFLLSATAETTISTSNLFANGNGAAWPRVITLTTVGDGAASQLAQTLSITVTSVPVGGATFRSYRTNANGLAVFGPANVLVSGENTITVPSSTFDRAAKIQFSTGEVSFDTLIVNGDELYPLPVNNTRSASLENSYLFSDGTNETWTKVITLTTPEDGASSQSTQTLNIAVTSLPAGGANYRIYKTNAQGNDYFAPAQALQLGSNPISVGSVGFDRTVKIQFSSGSVEFNDLTVNSVIQYPGAPQITLNGATSVDTPSGSPYADLGATAVDDIGDSIIPVLTGSVDTNTLGDYVLTYTATDVNGQSSTANRTVTVITADTEDPVVTLNGQTSLTLTQGDAFIDAGVTVIDNSGETIDAVVSGDTVDTSVPGVYTITYTATDSAGNSASTTRTVTVVEADTDGDGVVDSLDVHAGFDDAALSAYLSDNGYAQGGLTQQDLLDARVGSAAVSVSGGTATISLQLEQSADGMQTWSSPAEGATTVDIPVSGDASFFRVRAQ